MAAEVLPVFFQGTVCLLSLLITLTHLLFTAAVPVPTVSTAHAAAPPAGA